MIATTEGPLPSRPSWLVRVRAALRRFATAAEARRAAIQTQKESDAAAFARRPPGWRGYWSARYGEVLARTLNLSVPFTRSQSEMLAAIPRPLQETLDPVASLAEPMDRDGRPARWRLARSTLLELFGPLGLAVGAVVLALVALRLAIALWDLPPLTAPRSPQPQKQEVQRPSNPLQPPPQQQRPQQQQPQQQQQPPPQQQQQQPQPQQQPLPKQQKQPASRK